MIVAAAVRIPNTMYDGDMIVSQPPPARHFTIIHSLHDMGITPKGNDQGFLTSDGRFVSREEAYRIAKQCNQPFVSRPDGDCPGTLFSEDLW